MSVYDEIAAERQAQDKSWGGADHDDQHNAFDWVRFMVPHLGKAISVGAEVLDEGHWFSASLSGSVRSVPLFRQQMVRVAALAVAAIESHDRRAARNANGGAWAPGIAETDGANGGQGA